MTRSMVLAALLAAFASSVGCATADTPPGIAEGQQLLEEGRQLAREKLTVEAIRVFTRALRANPDLAEAYYERGKCHIQNRLHPISEGTSLEAEQWAIDDFSSAIQKNPAYADAYFNRAMVYCSKAQYKPAVDDLLNAVRFKPRDPEPHLWLGELYEKKFMDSLLLAMDHYEKYIDLGGTDGTVREKVKIWKDFRRQVPAATPEPAAKVPTPEDERKAQELHVKALQQLQNPDKTEAVKSFEDLLASYGHTKYVRAKLTAIQAAISAFKKKDAPK